MKLHLKNPPAKSGGKISIDSFWQVWADASNFTNSGPGFLMGRSNAIATTISSWISRKQSDQWQAVDYVELAKAFYMETLPEASIMEGSLRNCSHRTYPTPRSGTSACACCAKRCWRFQPWSAWKNLRKFWVRACGSFSRTRSASERSWVTSLAWRSSSWRFSTEVFCSQLVSKGCFVLHVLHFLRGLGRECPQRQCLQHLEISKTICNSPKHLPHQPSLSFPISRVVSDEVTFQKFRWRFRTLAW